MTPCVFLRKLVRQIRIDGVSGVLHKIPLWLRGRREARLDRAWGIRTAGQVEVEESASADGDPAQHEHQANAVFYAPLSFTKFRRLMDAARPFDASRYTFIDYGAGKGGALVLAASLDFRRVVGIELFASLHADALANIAALAARDRRAEAIELLCMDAAAYRPPPGDLFCYFYNPFDDVVMRKVLAILRSAHHASPRRILIAYANPLHAEVFDRADFLRGYHRSEGLRIYVNDGA